MTKKLHVKVNQLKLQHGFCEENKTMATETKWKGPSNSFKPSLLSLPFSRKSSLQKNRTALINLPRETQLIEWDDEFDRRCDFPLLPDNSSFCPWEIKFYVLSGDSRKSKGKVEVLGKVSLNLAELVMKMEYQNQIDQKLSITLKDGGVASQATLLVTVNFAQVRNSDESAGIAQNSSESNEPGLLKMVMNFTSFRKKNQERNFSNFRVLSSESYESTMLESERFPSGKSPSSETRLEQDPVQKNGFLPWKKRRLSLIRSTSRRKVEPLIEKTRGISDVIKVNIDCQKVNVLSPVDCTTTSSQEHNADSTEFSRETNTQLETNIIGSWETKEIVSRDKEAKLKTDVFFASFDQRSEKAAGESACTALVAVITHWLHSNRDLMPTTSEFNNLIISGSLEWQKLCTNQTYLNSFPDKHFDLETVMEANIRPISVSPEKSFVGFFRPEKFECLKDAMSFDQIWNEINRTIDDEPKIYIVSWNDHFFVLKVETNACYVVDSLGERLFEGCNQAYILKFDRSSMMYENAEREEEREREAVICGGKDCCREFFKRFLAAIPLREVEEEQEKKTSCSLFPYQRLQIDLHYSSSSNVATVTIDSS